MKEMRGRRLAERVLGGTGWSLWAKPMVRLVLFLELLCKRKETEGKLQA